MSRLNNNSNNNNTSSNMGESAIPFIQLNPSDPSKFQVQPAAIKMLSSIKGKIVPIVVAGPYRSGKSSLLNLLIDRNNNSSGFTVGGSVQAVTKGLYIWGAPIVIDGVNHILIDSEGLGSIDQSGNFDTQIFSLSILLSSLFILNTVGTIDEKSLEQLELVLQLTDKIRVNKTNNNNNNNAMITTELSQFSPVFVWVLRDFSLDLEIEGQTLTENQYLERALSSVPTANNNKRNNSITEKNRIRDAVRNMFPIRECVTLVRPVLSEKQLKQISTLPPNQLRPEFLQQIRLLKQKIQILAKPKSIDGQCLTGSAFVKLAEQYVNSINTGAIPTIRTAWGNVIELQSKDLIETIINNYNIFIEQQSQIHELLDEKQIDDLFNNCYKQAKELIIIECIGDEKNRQFIEDKIINHANKLKSNLLTLMQLKSKDVNKNVCEKLWNDINIDNKLRNNNYNNSTQLINDIDLFTKQYNLQCKGIDKLKYYYEFIDNKYKQIMVYLFSQLNKLNQLQDHIDKLNNELSAQKQKVVDNSNEYKLNMARLQLDIQGASKELDKVNKDNLNAVNKLSKQIETSNNTITSLNIQLLALTSDKHRLENELKNQQLTNQQHKQTEQQLNNTINQLQTEVAQKNKAVNKNDEYKSTTEKRIQSLTQQVNELNSKLSEKNNEINDLNQQLLVNERKSSQHSVNLSEINNYKSENQRLQKELDDYKAKYSKMALNLLTVQTKLDQAVANGNNNATIENNDINDEDDTHSGSKRKRSDNTNSNRVSSNRFSTGNNTIIDMNDNNNNNSSVELNNSFNIEDEVTSDPNTFTIQQLKSLLTKFDIILPMKAQPKTFYVDLLYEKFPTLANDWPRNAESDTKSKRKSTKK